MELYPAQNSDKMRAYVSYTTLSLASYTNIDKMRASDSCFYLKSESPYVSKTRSLWYVDHDLPIYKVLEV